MLGPGGIEVIVGAGRGVLGQREEWWRGSGNGDWRLHRRLYFGALTALLRRSYGALTVRRDSVAVAGRRCG